MIHHVVGPGHVDALFHGDVPDPTVLGCREEVLGTCPLADAFCRESLDPLFKQITYFIKANKQIEVQKYRTCTVTLNSWNDGHTTLHILRLYLPLSNTVFHRPTVNDIRAIIQAKHYMSLFTVPCFSVRSSRSSALRYGWPSWFQMFRGMSVKFT